MKIISNALLASNRSYYHSVDNKATEVKLFHETIPKYNTTPLQILKTKAKELGLAALLVKDESKRMELKAFKVMGASFAIGKLLQRKFKIKKLDFETIKAKAENKNDKIIFAAATDGNHGKGVAFTANQLGLKSIIYVPEVTVEARIRAIKEVGGKVKVIRGTYDDAVKKIVEDAKPNGWQIISDTSWPGYEEIPNWVMQGYFSIFKEIDQQIIEAGVKPPSHIFVQGGVGTLAASRISYYRSRHAKQEIKIVIVEPYGAACLFRSGEIADGNPYSYQGELKSIMAGLTCAVPNPLAWEIIKSGAIFFIKCNDKIAELGMREYYYPLTGDAQIISGESGAVTMGVINQLMKNKTYNKIRYPMLLNSKSRVLLINTEGDTDPDNFTKVIQK